MEGMSEKRLSRLKTWIGNFFNRLKGKSDFVREREVEDLTKWTTVEMLICIYHKKAKVSKSWSKTVHHHSHQRIPQWSLMYGLQVRPCRCSRSWSRDRLAGQCPRTRGSRDVRHLDGEEEDEKEEEEEEEEDEEEEKDEEEGKWESCKQTPLGNHPQIWFLLTATAIPLTRPQILCKGIDLI